MNNHPAPHLTFLTAKLLIIGLLAVAGFALPATAAPKKLLVVTTTMGFRHDSIPTAEKVLGEMAEKSGAFTVDYARVDISEGKYAGADGRPDKTKFAAGIKAVLAEKMSTEALKKYDGVIFANTTGGKQSGDLPLPDKQAFLDWIKSGKAFIGMHSATDTFDGYTPIDPYVEMIGAEFKTHPPGLYEVECINQDPQHPATKNYPAKFKVKDEIYIMNAFDRNKVHGLLTLDKHPKDQTPGDYPIAWCKEYGSGKVFYTSLGHSKEMWNDPQYQAHILGGIKWALGLEPGDAKPQTGK